MKTFLKTDSTGVAVDADLLLGLNEPLTVHRRSQNRKTFLKTDSTGVAVDADLLLGLNEPLTVHRRSQKCSHVKNMAYAYYLYLLSTYILLYV